MAKPGGRGPMTVNLDKAKNTKGTIKRLIKYLEGHKKTLIMVILFIILYVVCNIVKYINIINEPIYSALTKHQIKNTIAL